MSKKMTDWQWDLEYDSQFVFIHSTRTCAVHITSFLTSKGGMKSVDACIKDSALQEERSMSGVVNGMQGQAIEGFIYSRLHLCRHS